MTDEGRSYRGGRLIIRFLKEGEISKGACSGAKHLFWKVMFSYHTVIHIFLCVCVCGGGSGTFVNTSIDVWDEISDCSKNA